MRCSYSQLLSSLSGAGLREEAIPLPSELELQSLFFAGHFGRDFVTQEGEEVRIIQFGEWNHGPGPDFLHCAIELDGKALQGPIELDTRPADWEAHGHSQNPEFDEVILHITVEPSAKERFTRTTEHRQIPQAQIPPPLLAEILPPSVAQAPVTLGRCYFPLAEMPLPRLEELLKQAATYRAQKKAALFHCVAETHGYPQALWQALATALGFHQNRLAMTLLAQRAPLRLLRNLPPLERTAYLFGLAGFLAPDLPESAPAESRTWLRSLWTTWWKNRPHPDPRPLPWKFAGIRPSNHPQRRLAALATLLNSWPTLERQSRTSLADFAKTLEGMEDPFWSRHYTLTSRQTKQPIALFGRQRIQDFLANTLHPLRLSENAEIHWPSYQKLPGGQPSEKVLRAAYRLLGDRPEKASLLKKAWQQQGILQVYQDFCLKDHSDCENCPFPEQLQNW